MTGNYFASEVERARAGQDWGAGYLLMFPIDLYFWASHFFQLSRVHMAPHALPRVVR